MTAVRTARISRSFSRVSWKWFPRPLKRLKARLRPGVNVRESSRPRIRGIRRRSRDPDPHIDGRA